jgi:hypothetical protein
MIKINLSTFMDLYENGEVEDVVVIGSKIYARQYRWASKIPSSQRPKFRIVWAELP